MYPNMMLYLNSIEPELNISKRSSKFDCFASISRSCFLMKATSFVVRKQDPCVVCEQRSVTVESKLLRSCTLTFSGSTSSLVDLHSF